MSSLESFGHFLLPLTMNKGHVDAKTAEYIFAVRSRYLELKKDRPERHAIRNLLGMLAFRLTMFEEAFEYLDKVLADGEDPDNLNALANRKYMCEKLLRFPEARDCEQRIAKLLYPDSSEEGEKRCRKLRARSLAEQAFAYSFELFGESVSVERYLTSVDLYEQATKIAGNLIDQDEKEDWAVTFGMACQKIYNNKKRDKSLRDEAKTWFQKAVKNFILIIQFSRDCSLVSVSWRHLGELFKQPGELLPSITDDMKIYVRQPWRCFEKALSVSPGDPRIIARYAGHYQRINKSTALSKVDESIELDNSVFNLHAYYIRARIRIDKYKSELKGCKKYPHNLPDSTLLTFAEQDLRFTLQKSSTPWHLQSLAEVFYYKAKEPDGRVKLGSEGQKNLQLALIYCAKAVACQDGQKGGEIHKLRGDCLCAMDEHRAALGCFKRAVECETANQYFQGSGNSLVIEYEHILRATTSALPDDSSMLADMVYWLNKVAENCLFTNWTLWSLRNLKQLCDHWKTFVKYCNDNGYKTELESIELAATDASKRSKPPHIYRHQSVPTLGEGAPTAVKIRHESFPGTCSTVLAQSTSGNVVPVEIDKDVEAVADSLAEVGLEEKAVASDIIHITYAVNLKTGKTQHVETIPSIQDSSSDDVSSKHVRSAPERPLNRLELQYDFFVIYSSNASEWVQHCMLEELEGTGLKGCIKDRDFGLGKPKLDNYSDSIKDSVCTIVVITKDFETDKYCVRNMLLALELDKLVIPVLREARDMPTALKPIEFLDATGAVDWGRLERSIEQQIKLDVR